MAAVVSATACLQSSPASWVEEAEQAYARALEAEADRYSPDSLALASRVLEDGLAEVERQSQKPIFFRDYAHARSLLGQAGQLARGARYEARARRDQLRAEVATILARVSHDLTNLERDVPASADKDVTEWTAWIRRYRAASDALAEARAAFRDGNYFDARAHASRVVEQLRALENRSPSS